MLRYTITNIAAIIHANTLQCFRDETIDHILLDSRRLLFTDNTLFFALSGPRRQGLDFVLDLYQKGVRNFIVDEQFDLSALSQISEANVLQVNDSLQALQTLAIAHRKLFSYPVIGITGSNGKTIVKEWLFQLLNSHYNIIRSPKSYNSQIGVPLSIWQMKAEHSLGIFEAGISKAGEMIKLSSIIRPDIGILTYMGDAHAEGFLNFQQKLQEKLLLFTMSKVLIYCNDNPEVAEHVESFIKQQSNQLTTFTWGRNEHAQLVLKNVTKHQNSSILLCNYKELEFSFSIPFTDEAAVFNAMTCCATLLYLNIDTNTISQSMKQLRAVAMRLELKKAINQCFVINDSYSADIDSLKIALDFLSQQDFHTKKTLILSDLLESGIKNEGLYKQLSKIIIEKKTDRFIGIGKNMMQFKDCFSDLNNLEFFLTTDDFLTSGILSSFQHETILLKGARVFEFEKISLALEEKIHDTILEINLTAVRNNLKKYQQQLSPQVKTMAMVKAFSYGSGAHEIPALLQQEGVDYLAVAYTDEGVGIRNAGIRTPIMVMNTTEEAFDNIIQYNLEPEIYSPKILSSFIQFLQTKNILQYPIHIKLDTGMHRLGFMDTEVDGLLDILGKTNNIAIKSIFSHLVASENPASDEFTQQQASLFISMSTTIENAVGYRAIKHIANTTAIRRHPQLQFDMVRLGIGLYGIDTQFELENVSTLKTTIAQIKHVKKGASVGYGRSAVLEMDSLIATVRIGYADGYSRVFGNGNGKMLVSGKMVPVVGNVCMDMTMLDITGIDAKEGDEVIVFGAPLSIQLLADWANTIPYEIMTGVSQRVKRVFFEE